MKVKFLSMILVSSAIFFASCNTIENDTQITENTNSEITTKNVAVALPVEILVDSNFEKKIPSVTLTRTINSAVITDFASENELAQLKDFYNPELKMLDTSTFNEYKKVTLSLGHTFESSNTKTQNQTAFVLDKQTSFIIGKNELHYNEFVNRQLAFLATSYSVKQTADLQKEYTIAIPNEFINENLQLKTIQQIEDEINIIYLNLDNQAKSR